jgi:transcriptional regulator with XRE-family HTH domain
LSKKTFSNYLIKKRDDAHLTNSKLANIAQISAVYLGEIIKNKKKPPDKKTQYALAKALNLTDREKEEMFNLAAFERGEIPADVYDYILENNDLIGEIRNKRNGKMEKNNGGVV